MLVDNNFLVASGYYKTKYDLMHSIDYYLTKTIHGWTGYKNLIDDGSNFSSVYYRVLPI